LGRVLATVKGVIRRADDRWRAPFINAGRLCLTENLSKSDGAVVLVGFDLAVEVAVALQDSAALPAID
jgi:hypothetical protein